MSGFLLTKGFISTSFNFSRFKIISYALALAVIIGAPIFIMIRGINFGVDFLGGTLVEVRSDKDIPEIRRDMEVLGYSVNSIYNDSENNIIIKVHVDDLDSFESVLKEKLSYLDVKRIDFVGPKLGVDMLVSGASGIVAAIIAMILYIAIRFNKLFGISMGITLIHDLVGVMLFYSITQYEFDASAVAAILTILGYSVNDSVVIFDRIRENSTRFYKMSLKNVIDKSLNETLSRTTITAITTLLACISLFIFGGPSLKGFAGAMTFGIVFGTYSSIFISAPLVLSLSTMRGNRDV